MREENTFQTTHQVKSGDTLSHLALTYLGAASRYPEIARENRIQNPDLIFAGSALSISGITEERMKRLRPAHFMDDSDLSTELTQ